MICLKNDLISYQRIIIDTQTLYFIQVNYIWYNVSKYVNMYYKRNKTY